MRARRIVLWGLAAFLVGTAPAVGQVEKKEPDKAPRGFDASGFFDHLAKGKDAWERPSDPTLQQLFDRVAEKMGVTNGRITREQFINYMNKPREARMARQGNSPTGQPGRVDLYGDPLPAGAVARLGTVRLRHEGLSGAAFGLDGKTLITDGADRFVRIWDVDSGKELGYFDSRLEAEPGSPRRLLESRGIGHEGGMVLSRDRQLLALRNVFGGVSLWDMNKGQPVRPLVSNNPPSDAPDPVARLQQRFTAPLAFSPDGKYLAVQKQKGVWLFETATGKEIRQLGKDEDGGRFRLPGTAPLAVFSPDGKRLTWGGMGSVGSKDRVGVMVWEVETGKEVLRFQAPSRFDQLYALSPDGKAAVVGGSEGDRLALWDLATNKKVFGLPTSVTRRPSVVQFSPSGALLALWDKDTIYLFDAASGTQRRVLGEQAGEARNRRRVSLVLSRGKPVMAFSPDGSRLAVGGDTDALRIWDVATGKPLGGHFGHQGGIQSVRVSPDGRTATTLGTDGTVRQWDIGRGKELCRQTLPAASDGASLSADGRLVAAPITYRAFQVLEVATGREIRRQERRERATPDPWVANLTLSPDGQSVAVKSLKGVIRLLDVATGRERWLTENQGSLGPLTGSYTSLSPVAFSLDGRVTAMVDLEDENMPATGNAAPGRRLGTGVQSTIRLLDTASGRVLRRFDKQTGPITAMTFSWDGRSLAAANQDNSLAIWEVATGKKRLQIQRDGRNSLRSALGAMAFAPDGRLLATAETDESVRLRDTVTGQEVSRHTGHHGVVSDVAFTPDGAALLSASTDSTVLVWPVVNRPLPAKTLESAQLGRLWADLKAEDAAKAYQAVCTLSADPVQTLALLRRELRTAPAPDAKRVTQLIADLNSDQFDTREKANQELEKLGNMAEPLLRQALTGDLPVEVRRRLEHLLARPEAPPSGPESIQSLRAVEVLERIGTTEAKAVLRSLAQGTAGYWLTREAKVTLERLNGSIPARP